MTGFEYSQLEASLVIETVDADIPVIITSGCSPKCRFRFDSQKPYCQLFNKKLEQIECGLAGIASRCQECVDLFDKTGFVVHQDGEDDYREFGKL